MNIKGVELKDMFALGQSAKEVGNSAIRQQAECLLLFFPHAKCQYEIISSISGYKSDKVALAFDPNGEFFFLYDADQKALYRCRTWW